MTMLKSLTIVAALLVGGTSLAIAQGPPTGGEPSVAGGAHGNPILNRQSGYSNSALRQCETDQKASATCACGPARMTCPKGMWCHAFISFCEP
jgi:hypothetical protein